MKKTYLLLIFIVAMFQNYAQEFAPIGAVWHYTQWTVNPNFTSFKTIESISDTTINGIQCRKMIEVEHYINTTNVIYHYMYAENDSVFFFAENNFHLLYDFGANTGDTIILDYYPTFNGTPLKMIIDSTSTVIINNEERKIQYITSGDGVIIEFGHHVIEGIGNTSFMFPTLEGSMNGPLRCYQDSIVGLFLNPFYLVSGWNYQDCEYIFTSINDIGFLDEIAVFPNPTNRIVTITNIDRQTEFLLFDNVGKLMIRGNLNREKEINLTKFPDGIYYIELKNKNIRTIKKIIKK